jgi:hypothetical protein
MIESESEALPFGLIADPCFFSTFQQAPPFYEWLEDLQQHKTPKLANLSQENYLEEAGEVAASLYSLTGPEWYRGKFLAPGKFSDEDKTFLLTAFKNDIFLEPGEIHRLDFELWVNDGESLIHALSQVKPTGIELQRRLPKRGISKKSLGQIVDALALLPNSARVHLSKISPPEMTKASLYKLLNWLVAYYPAHREIIDGKSIICTRTDCEFTPEPEPRVQAKKDKAVVSGNGRNFETVTISEDVPLASSNLNNELFESFKVLKSDIFFEAANHSKLNVNFSRKELVINSQRGSIFIVREVKTPLDPLGKVSFGFLNPASKLSITGQISAAWWFEEVAALVFITQESGVYLLHQESIRKLAQVEGHSWNSSCVLGADKSTFLISLNQDKLLTFGLNDESQSRSFKLGTIPHSIFLKICEMQIDHFKKPDFQLQDFELPKIISSLALNELSNVTRNTANKLCQADILTLGDLLRHEKSEILEKFAIQGRSLDLENFLATGLAHEMSISQAENTGIQIWEYLAARGWVKEIDFSENYALPSVRILKCFEKESPIVTICGLAGEGERYFLRLTCGITLVLNTQFQIEFIQVATWKPNMFLELLSKKFGRLK